MTEWVITSSFLILVVLALRAALGRKINARLRYALWGVVLVRLLLPVSLFSLEMFVQIPKMPNLVPPETFQEESIYILPVDSVPLENSGVHMAEDGAILDSNSFGYPRLTDDGEKVVRYAEKISPMRLLGCLWMVGTAVMGMVLAAANWRFGLRLRRVRKPLEGISTPVPVYVAESLPSPCLVGVLRPVVYIPVETAEDPVMLRHMLAHELTHYNHRDHLWSALRGVALAVHWWNPLVWVAAICSRRDGELACDESALYQLGDGERAAYGETLLALVTAKSRPGDLFGFATTMSGAKRSLRERIQRIASQPKQFVSAVVVVVTLVTFASVAAFGQAGAVLESENTNDAVPPLEEDITDEWQTANILLDEDGVAHIRYNLPDGIKDLPSKPIPAPIEWADPDALESRKTAVALEGSPDIWAKLVSKTEGWLVATYGRGVAAADTYVYRTEDGGMNWTQTAAPGTSWQLSIVGFLDAERLIVAQRLFDGAPCFITKDGGQTWEEIHLPSTMVTAFKFDGETVTMYVGPNETDPTIYFMTSGDLGDTWTSTVALAGYHARTESQPSATRIATPDLDHDGVPDMLTLQPTNNMGDYDAMWSLEFTASNMSEPTWEVEVGTPHVVWISYYLCPVDGQDCLLEYRPYIGGGGCDYSYKLFYLTSDGREVVLQENEVHFDVIFAPEFADTHHFDPEEINAFLEEINALLEKSELLVNTDENLQATFEKEGRLYDSVWWLDEDRDDNLTLLENLHNYGSHAGNPPDNTTDPLSQLPTPDLDHDGKPDELVFRSESDPGLLGSYDGTSWTLQCNLSGGGAWEIEGCPSLPGCNTVFLYQMNGQDYLLVYVPYFWHGQGYYEYRLIYLDGGREVVVKENSVGFDTRFRGDTDEKFGFEPEAIAAFMDEVNALLIDSTQIVNTSIYLQQVFEEEGRLYDHLYWLDDKWREDGLTMLEILQNYGRYYGDHPDIAWSVLSDLLEGLTESDIQMFNGDTAKLVRLLQSAERGSRFYPYKSEADAYVGLGGEEEDYTIWNLPLTDGSTLWLMACEEKPSVAMIYERPEETVAAFYTAPELKEWILVGID